MYRALTSCLGAGSAKVGACLDLVPSLDFFFFPSQNAGNQLRGLQRAVKNPFGNAGILVSEVGKRVRRY